MKNIGDKAPEVLGINEKGEEIRLSAYKMCIRDSVKTAPCTAAPTATTSSGFTPLEGVLSLIHILIQRPEEYPVTVDATV